MGSYTRSYNWVNDRDAGVKITASRMDTETDGIVSNLNNRLDKDGSVTPTANQPMGGFKHTNVADATARTDYAAAGQIQDGDFIWCGTATGTADVITLTPAPAITAYAAGNVFRFISSGANTTNVTVNVSGLGAKAITKNGSTALAAGDIPSGAVVEIHYDGTRFQMLGVVADRVAATANTTFTGNNTFSGDNDVKDTLEIYDPSDTTKKARIDVGGVSTATTRVITVPDVDVTLPYKPGTYGSMQVYTSSDTWTKPSGLKRVKVTVIGGGGGGGGCVQGTNSAGGGGGAGGCSIKTVEAASLGATETVTVGAAGSGGGAGANNGSAGGQSSFGAHAVGNGGSGGTGVSGSSAGAGGAGGTATSGDINISGGPGFIGNGVAIGTAGAGGNGGTSYFGGGGSGGFSSANGGAASVYGSGGGGAADNDTSSRAGGAGSAGIVIVEEFF